MADHLPPVTVAHPWRRVARTVLQVALALAILIPLVAQELDLDPARLPWLAVVLAVVGGFTRVMALPAVEVFLRRFVPWLAADDVAAEQVTARVVRGQVVAGPASPLPDGTTVAVVKG